MKCPNCGEENLEDSKFCQGCGTELTAPQAEKNDAAKEEVINEAVQEAAAEIQAESEPVESVKPEPVSASVQKPAVPEEPEKKKINKKYVTFGVLAAAVVLIVILIVTAVRSSSSSKFGKQTNTIECVYNTADKQTEIIIDNKKLSDVIDGKVYSSQTNLSGNAAAVLGEDKVLYYITVNSVKELAQDVDTFVLSADGKQVAYLDEDDTLYLCSCSDGKASKIESDLSSSYFVISPDGKSVLYVAEGEDENELYVYTKNSSTKLGKGLFPVAVSNSAKYIYAYNSENSGLYMLDMNGEKNKLAADLSSSYVVMNKDHTQILFYSDSKNYISVKGGDKVKVASSSDIWPLVSFETGLIYQYTGRMAVITCNIDSLLDNLYEDEDGGVYYIDKQTESRKCVSNTDKSSVVLTGDGKTFYYIKNDKLYKCSYAEDAEPEELAEDVRSFAVSSDGKYVYYINEDDELRYLKGGKEGKKIADDVYTMEITGKDVLLFLTDYAKNAGTLYYTKNGGTKEKIADDVYQITVTATAAYYAADYNNSKCSLYASNGDTKFQNIVEEYSSY